MLIKKGVTCVPELKLLLILLLFLFPCKVLVIIDAKPKELGLPTEAYIAIEEVHDVRKVLHSFRLLIVLCYLSKLSQLREYFRESYEIRVLAEIYLRGFQLNLKKIFCYDTSEIILCFKCVDINLHDLHV